MGNTFLRSILLITTCFFIGCSDSGPPSTQTNSGDAKFDQLEKKIEFFEQYITFRRTYNDLDFSITYHNNSGGILPGPSDWSMRVIAQIPKAEIELWTNGMQPTTAPNTGWMKNMPGSIDYSGVSTWFRSDIRMVGVDEENAVIVYVNSTL